MTLFEQFEEFERQRDAGHAAVSVAADALRDGPTAHERAKAEHREQVIGAVSGERESDEQREAELFAAVQATGEAVTWRIIDYPSGARGELVDLRAEAELAGARRRVEIAERQLEQFAREHAGGLMAELAAGMCQQAGIEALAAISALLLAGRRWNGAYKRVTDVVRAAGVSDLLASVPANPCALAAPVAEAEVVRGPVPLDLM